MRISLVPASICFGLAITVLAPTASANTVVVGPRGNPVAALPAAHGPRYVIGVMGGAGKTERPEVSKAVARLGATIATLGHVTLTGACPGYPHDALRAAKAAGGLTIGISGYSSKKAHVASGAPVDGFDVIQYTSLPAAQRGQVRPNYMGREIDNIERSNALVFAGGRSGTLGEFAIAYEEGRPIGVLTGSGGVSDQLQHLVEVMKKEGKPPRAPVVYDSNPERLIHRLIKAVGKKRESVWKREG